MGIPICFVLFLIFVVIFNIKLNRNSNNDDGTKQFYEDEIKALSIRKKPLDDINFIKLNINSLPLLEENDIKTDADKEIFEKQNYIIELSDKPMACFRDISNLDLKLKYGVANLNTLINYEADYNELLKQLIKLAELYYDVEEYKKAQLILEEGITLNSDLSKNYLLLGKIYIIQKNYTDFDNLKARVQMSNLSCKEKLLNHFATRAF